MKVPQSVLGDHVGFVLNRGSICSRLVRPLSCDTTCRIESRLFVRQVVVLTAVQIEDEGIPASKYPIRG
jgi:hypothetical protein